MDLGELVGHIIVKDDYKKNLADAKKEFSSVGDAVDEGVSKSSGKLAKTAATVGAVGGAAVAGGLAVGFANSLNTEVAQKKLEAQLGAGSQMAKDAGQVAGSLYASAYGGSLEEVNEAVRNVIQSGAVMEDASNEQIQSITAQALSLRDAFGVEVSESMRAVGQLVKTQMAPDAEAGLDLITRAFQQLGPQAADVIDTFTEYSVQFQKIGIDGKQALGMIQQMVQAGARDTDVAADALKEFAVRAVDGSKSTIDGFTAIGLNADEMARKFATGGTTATDAFAQTITALKNMNDPLLQSQTAVALFGTQAEDLGAALYAIDPSTAVAGLGNLADAAERVDETIGDTSQAKLTSMQRGWEQFLAGIVSAPGILGTASAALVTFGVDGLSMAASVAMISTALPASWATAATGVVSSAATMATAAATWVTSQAVSAATAIATMVATAARYVLQWVIMSAAAIANAAVMAAAWLIALGPIGLVIAAIVGLVALIIANWDAIKNVTVKVWQSVWDFIKQVWEWIKQGIKAAVDFIVNLFLNWTLIGLIIKHWDTIKRVFSEGVNAAVNFVKDLPGKIWNILSSFSLIDAGKKIIQTLIDGIMAMVGKVGDAIMFIVRKIRDALPFSPAKWGPLSGSGSPDIAGQTIGRMLADGIRRSLAEVSNATVLMTATANPASAITSNQLGSSLGGSIDIRDLETALERAVRLAMDKARLLIEGSGTAKLVSTTDQLNTRRMGGFSG